MENELGGFSTCLFTTMDAPDAEKINEKHLNMMIQNEDDQDWEEILGEIQFVAPDDFNATTDILKDILKCQWRCPLMASQTCFQKVTTLPCN